MPDRVRGAVLFADISGFTPLTEALARELGPQRGPEELSRVLELVFDAVLSELHRFGGTVIYFSGDAVTCWFDGDDGTLAIGCGLAMQVAMARVGTITTPAGTTVQLGMKVALTTGPARRFVVGDPEIQLIDTLAGSLLDRVADLEHHAERGEVLVDSATLDAIGSGVELAVVKADKEAGFAVVAAFTGGAVPARLPPPARLARSISRRWVLPPVYERLRTGGSFLAELRPVIPMFLRFGGFDFDGDDDAPAQLDHFIRRVQQVVDSFGGNVLQLTIGDKGAYLYSVFGAPLAHEDDAHRACAAALAVLDLEGQTAAAGLQIGLSRGPLFSGTYGHRHRCTFTCLGDATNLAARLMSAAPEGQIYVAADVAAEVTGRFHFEPLEPMTVKGKSDPVSVSRLVAATDGTAGRGRSHHGLFIGRDDELAVLSDLGAEAGAGRLQVAAVVAEAGLGKSTLVEQVAARLADAGMEVLAGAASSIGSGSYQVWRDICRPLFGLTGDGDPVAELTASLEQVDTDLLSRLPLLGPLLGIPLEDNELTGGFEAKIRKSSLEALVLDYLRARAAGRPMVLWLEDCHWIDSLSADLLQVLVRNLVDLPILVVLTYRAGPFTAPKSPRTTTIELDRLRPAACEQLLRSRLADLYGAGTRPSPDLVERLVERAGGNPFYVGELANYLHSRRVDLTDAGAGSIELPVSLSTLVLSRVDALAESPRRTLKVASVVGRDFGLDEVVGAFPEVGARRQVTGYLRRLCANDLVVQEDPSVDGYAFKHAVIREVTYGSLPYALRGRLHDSIGGWLEQTSPDALDLLAHHFWHGTDDDRKRYYLVRAGDAAQSRFAIDAAVDYFRRVTPLLAEPDRVDVMMKLGTVLGLSGEWAESEAVFGQEAMDVAGAIGDAVASARAQTERADAVRNQGRFDEATEQLRQAASQLEQAGDRAVQGRVLHLRGTIAAQQGDYARARECYLRSLEIRVEFGDRQAEGALYSNLAILAEYEEDYEQSRLLNEKALALWSGIGYRWGTAISNNNLGMVAYLENDYERARAHLEAAAAIAFEMGDPTIQANARHTLGHTARELGEPDIALRYYADALKAFALSGDRWSQCAILEDIAMLFVGDDPAHALEFLGAAEAMRDAIGSPREAVQVAKIEIAFASTLEVAGAADHLGRGRQMAPDVAIEQALMLCEGVSARM